jgi:hypothetical protein
MTTQVADARHSVNLPLVGTEAGGLPDSRAQLVVRLSRLSGSPYLSSGVVFHRQQVTSDPGVGAMLVREVPEPSACALFLGALLRTHRRRAGRHAHSAGLGMPSHTRVHITCPTLSRGHGALQGCDVNGW